MSLYKIAGSYIEIAGASGCIPDAFDDFLVRDEEPGKESERENLCQKVELILEPGIPKRMADLMQEAGAHEAKGIVHSNYFTVYEREEHLYLNYIQYENLFISIISKDRAQVMIYVDQENFEKRPDALKNMLLYVLRDAYLPWIQRQGKLAFHSSTIVYREKAYAFSGASGTGKTTHTNLWIDAYQVPILDGDMCVLTEKEDGRFYAYGLPWCGTSGQYRNECWPLGGIIFLEQASENRVYELSDAQAEVPLICQSFSPNWTKEMMNYTIDICDRIIERKTPVWLLENRPEQAAMELIKKAIDQLI